MTVELGDRVKDSITGWQGVVTSIHSYLWACRRIGITPEKLDKDGKVIEPQSFDEPQVLILEKTVAGPASIIEAKPRARTGGPRRFEPSR